MLESGSSIVLGSVLSVNSIQSDGRFLSELSRKLLLQISSKKEPLQQSGFSRSLIKIGFGSPRKSFSATNLRAHQDGGRFTISRPHSISYSRKSHIYLLFWRSRFFSVFVSFGALNIQTVHYLTSDCPQSLALYV